MIKRVLAYKWYIVIILLLIVIEPAITSWMVLWLQDILLRVEVNTSTRTILWLLLIGVLVWIVKRVLLYLTSVIKARFVCNVKRDLKHDIFTKALGLNTASINQIASSGEYLSVFTNDINIIEQRYFLNIIGVCSQIINILVLGVTFLSMNLKLAVIMYVFSAFVMLIQPLFVNNLNSTNLYYSNQLSKFTQKTKEYLSAYSTIKNYSIENSVMNRFDEINNDVENAKFNSDCTLSVADSVGSLLVWFTRILVIGAGLVMVSKGEIQLATVMAAQTFAEEVATPFQGIVENVNSLKSVKSIISKINTMITKTGSTQSPAVASVKNGKPIEVEFRSVSVSAKDYMLIKDFSFDFKPGCKYLVLGKNGAGKSTLFKLLKNRVGEYSGDVYVDGIELRQLDNAQISGAISYLHENVSVFSGSALENMTLWRNIDPNKLARALGDAHIEIDLNKTIGEDGYNISSGEQRRIEIARTMMGEADFLIFDEVVSTLDVETAYEIERMTLGFDNKTVVFISHNFSGKLIRQYDEILIIRDGELVAHGSYDDLISSNEYFRQICDIKFGSVCI